MIRGHRFAAIERHYYQEPEPTFDDEHYQMEEDFDPEEGESDQQRYDRLVRKLVEEIRK